MENWKITRENAIDWGATLLLALPLCFFALANWPQQPEGTLTYYLRKLGTAGIVLLCYKSSMICDPRQRSWVSLVLTTRFRGTPPWRRTWSIQSAWQ